MEGSGLGLIDVLSGNLPGVSDVNHEEPQSG
jgi:hypothetical protein